MLNSMLKRLAVPLVLAGTVVTGAVVLADPQPDPNEPDPAGPAVKSDEVKKVPRKESSPKKTASRKAAEVKEETAKPAQPVAQPSHPAPRPVIYGGMGGMGTMAGPMDSFQKKRMEQTYRIEIAELAPRVAAADKSPRTQTILKKLDEPISMSFAHETPLEDVLKYIKSASQAPNDSGIPIYVDPAGLNEVEKTMTSPVTLDLEGVPLKTTLRLLLKQVGLAYCVKDGLLLISSPGEILEELREFETTHPEIRVEGSSMGLPGGPGGMGNPGGFR